MIPTREVFWNVEASWRVYLLFIPFALLFAAAVWQRARWWRLGRPEVRWDRPLRRLGHFLGNAVAQGRMFRQTAAGLGHLSFSWGFIVLFMGTLVAMAHEDLGIRIMQGAFYLWFQSLALDLFGLAATVGILIYAYLRYVRRLPRLQRRAGDHFVTGVFLLLLLQGFALEGMRFAAEPDPWMLWSPVGYAASFLFGPFDRQAILAAHRFTWWWHLWTTLAFLAYFPFSKMMHILTGWLNVYFANPERRGVLQPVALEEAETLGVRDFPQFTWKQLLDMDACTECNRCTSVCPANSVGKLLDPRRVITDLRDDLHQRGPLLMAEGDTLEVGAPSPLAAELEGTSPEALWACLTCGACMEECPVFIEHVPTIVDLRRYQVMERAELPETMADALQSLESRGHPFRGSAASRTSWYEGLEVPLARDRGEFEVLYWVGCATAFEERNQQIARSVVSLLQKAGVDFAILGDEEGCTGDPARRIGNEYLFQQLARANIEVLSRYRFRRILTNCAHCFNTLANEYPQLDGRYQVVHHTVFLQELVEQGRLSPSRRVEELITYHDPCYIGRYNQIYEEPRSVLSSLPGARLTEMHQHKSKAFCCGGGGGLLWIEERADQRVNNRRSQHAVDTGADTVGVACPFCMIMFQDGVKAVKGERQVAVKDVAELLDEATS